VLFKVYFKVNTLQLCGKLINVVEGPGGIMDNLRLFPVSDVVMYKYYIGRLKMFEDKYEEARYDMTSIPSPPNSYT
jgi:nuclear mRNA export protein PCID2/THP1